MVVQRQLIAGLDKYRPKEEYKSSDPLIERANNVDIVKLMSDFLGLYVPRTDRSWKMVCPFGQEHPDGGKLDKGFRVYPSTNSSYCFVQHGSMRPVRLISLYTGLPYKRAAVKILEKYGMLKPRSYREQYNELILRQATKEQSLGDSNNIVEALWTALSAVPGYERAQFQEKFLDLVDRQLEQLDVILGDRNSSDATLREWYSSTKQQLQESIQEYR